MAAALLIAAFFWSGSIMLSDVTVQRIERKLASRATIEFTDDFRHLQETWQVARKSWSYHPDGYARTGQLALFPSSLHLSDYRFEFLAQIEQKSVGWVFRARDPRNYYAMKFTVLRPGPLPVLAVVHYWVIEGRKGPVAEEPVTVTMHNNMPYSIAVRVSGSRFTTFVEGEQVDSWTDNQLTSGGVGFFSDPGERARLYWMAVTANDDLLGRICAFFAAKPAPPIQTSYRKRRNNESDIRCAFERGLFAPGRQA
ncbi:MAG: hypothetical protein M1541_09160 [Acidobacteria bacterium]|nr:hypothetical protein [Acidobacteriota bacterium]